MYLKWVELPYSPVVLAGQWMSYKVNQSESFTGDVSA